MVVFQLKLSNVELLMLGVMKLSIKNITFLPLGNEV